MEIETSKKIEYEDPDVIRGLRAALDEVAQMQAGQDSAMEGMREVGKTLFTSSSLIISAIGLINFPAIIASGPSIWRTVGFSFLAFLYVIFAVLTWKSINPVGWTTAFLEDYESLTKSLCKEEAMMVAQQLTGHLNALNQNSKVVNQRRKYLKWAGITMIAIIVILLLTVALT